MPVCPETPKTERPEALGFRPQKMVDWFEPAQLISTGIRAVLSLLFGAYADKREVQAALVTDVHVEDYAERPELWIDYIADVGDGWDSTYSMAYLLARHSLYLRLVDGREAELQRGQILIMGGDQVYPTATREAYQNRLVGPYSAALPCEVEQEPPHLYAIPGNHDWYDGLTAFTRLFMQQRWIGGWKTRQRRSYFALKLPHNWWLLGIDIQLAADIDLPQLDFFRHVSEQFQPGDQVILCTAQPEWLHAAGDPGAFKNLAFFEKQFILKRGAELRLTLTGDLHHYAHYQEPNLDHHKITAGGGGAYLYPTHELPAQIELPSLGESYILSAVYPDEATSQSLTAGALALPIRNWKFSLLLGIVYFLLVWTLQAASLAGGETLVGTILAGGFNLADFFIALQKFFSVLAFSPLALVLALLLIGGMAAFAAGEQRYSVPVGIVHGLAHLGLAVKLVFALALFDHHILGLHFDTFWSYAVFAVEVIVLGGLLGGFLMGLYLFIAARFLGMNVNEAFSSQHIADYKNFIRMHLDTDGNLTLYPIGVERANRAWRLNTAAKNGEPWFVPADRNHPTYHFIEQPIFLAKKHHRGGKAS